MTRLTGFSPKVRHLIKERAGVVGEYVRCEGCGVWCDAGYYEIHHRMPRSSGGARRPFVNEAANGIVLCRPDHAWAESERDAAREKGWLLSAVAKGVVPAAVPVVMHHGTVLLSDDGCYVSVGEVA